MKPLDLEAVKAGAAFCSSDHPKHQLSFLAVTSTGAIACERKLSPILSYTVVEQYNPAGLCMRPQVVRKWVCVYNNLVARRPWTGELHDSEAAARDVGYSGAYRDFVVATAEVSWEE